MIPQSGREPSAALLVMTVLQDTERVLGKSSYLGKPLVPKFGKESEMLKGIRGDRVPTLLGYAVTTAKEGAEVTLYTDGRGEADPLLAAWRYCLGKAVAFTSDAEARWSAEMVRWKKFRIFWSQVVRWTMRKKPESRYNHMPPFS